MSQEADSSPKCPFRQEAIASSLLVFSGPHCRGWDEQQVIHPLPSRRQKVVGAMLPVQHKSLQKSFYKFSFISGNLIILSWWSLAQLTLVLVSSIFFVLFYAKNYFPWPYHLSSGRKKDITHFLRLKFIECFLPGLCLGHHLRISKESSAAE